MSQRLQYVDVRDQQVLITGYSKETVDELYRFGTVLAASVEQHSGQMDAKLAVYLGYSATLVGVIFAGVAIGHISSGLRALIFVSIIFLLSALLLSAFGLRSRLWTVPSEKDWFAEDLLEDADRLRQYHVISLLLSHQDSQRNNGVKAKVSRTVETLLVLGTILSAVALLIKLSSV